MSRRVVVATPCYSGRVVVQYLQSLLASVEHLRREGLQVRTAIRAGNSVIAFARNEIVAEFLSSGDDDLIMIDDDMGWSADDLVRLLAHDAPFVAAVGRVKKDDPLYCVEPLTLEGRVEPHGALVEVGAVGGAFVRLRRDAAARMAEAYRDRRYTARGVAPEIAPFLTDLFTGGVEDGAAVSEDYAFCRRWRAIGGKVLVDPEIALAHVGTKAFTGRLADILRSPT